MSKYAHFEDLPVWQEAARLYNETLDLLEMPQLAASPGFRSQLDRAALSVSNNIAEGFDRVTTGELLAFLAIARGSAAEVQSMIAVIARRPKLVGCRARFDRIRALAQSCARQITGWVGSIEASPVQGKRHLNPRQRGTRQAQQAVQKYRLQFLRDLQPNHPLYHTSEARAARGEADPSPKANIP